VASAAAVAVVDAVANAKCLMLFAQAAALKHRCRLSQIRLSLFFAVIALRSHATAN
jgi:hypothetical protein